MLEFDKTDSQYREPQRGAQEGDPMRTVLANLADQGKKRIAKIVEAEIATPQNSN